MIITIETKDCFKLDQILPVHEISVICIENDESAKKFTNSVCIHENLPSKMTQSAKRACFLKLFEEIFNEYFS